MTSALSARNRLTEKGIFSSKIYSDEILIGEIFATHFYRQLDEFQMMMIVASICYESRERTEFYRKYPSKSANELKKLIWTDDFLRREKKFREIDNLTSLIHPLYHGGDLFKILENTNLLEGDVIRFFRQITDKLGQIKSATDDERLRDMLSSCQKLADDCIGKFDMI